jgi:pimeloyl-ACP methyl ester carboxylesterase
VYSASWYDHVRDLSGLINIFRSEMKRPIFGVGHSMGGSQLANLAIIHPRLFQGLILIDPVMTAGPTPGGPIMAKLSTLRKDKWPSRKVALESFKKSKFYQAWDPRVLNLWVEYGLRDLPTKLYPDVPASTEPSDPNAHEVTLTTTKHQEVFTFLRHVTNEAKANLDSFTEEEKAELFKFTHPDIQGWEHEQQYRAEMVESFHKLPHLRPSVFYIFGEGSDLSEAKAVAEKMKSTGSGSGGSGGVKAGRVKEIMMKDTGHLIPMDKPVETARVCVSWLLPEIERWKREEDLLKRFWEAQSDRNKFTVTDKVVAEARTALAALSKGASKQKAKI